MSYNSYYIITKHSSFDMVSDFRPDHYMNIIRENSLVPLNEKKDAPDLRLTSIFKQSVKPTADQAASIQTAVNHIKSSDIIAAVEDLERSCNRIPLAEALQKLLTIKTTLQAVDAYQEEVYETLKYETDTLTKYITLREKLEYMRGEETLRHHPYFHGTMSGLEAAKEFAKLKSTATASILRFDPESKVYYISRRSEKGMIMHLEVNKEMIASFSSSNAMDALIQEGKFPLNNLIPPAGIQKKLASPLLQPRQHLHNKNHATKKDLPKRGILKKGKDENSQPTAKPTRKKIRFAPESERRTALSTGEVLSQEKVSTKPHSLRYFGSSTTSKQDAPLKKLEKNEFYLGRLSTAEAETKLETKGDAFLFSNTDDGEFTLIVLDAEGSIYHYLVDKELQSWLKEPLDDAKWEKLATLDVTNLILKPAPTLIEVWQSAAMLKASQVHPFLLQKKEGAWCFWYDRNEDSAKISILKGGKIVDIEVEDIPSVIRNIADGVTPQLIAGAHKYYDPIVIAKKVVEIMKNQRKKRLGDLQ